MLDFDLPARSPRVLRKKAAGDLTWQEGAHITALLQSHLRTLETSEPESRVLVLETWRGTR